MGRTFRYLAMTLAGAPLLGTSGCDVTDSILRTIGLAFNIVDIWV